MEIRSLIQCNFLQLVGVNRLIKSICLRVSKSMPCDKKELLEFVSRWQGRGYEKGDTQQFWLQLLRIIGYSKVDDVLFEFHVSSGGFIDVWIPDAGVLIEQKRLELT